MNRRSSVPPLLLEPSPLALSNAAELAAIKTRLAATDQDISSLQASFDAFTGEVRKGFASLQQRNPMIWVGVIAGALPFLLAAAALNFYVINAQISPLKEAKLAQDDKIHEMREKQGNDHDSLIRAEDGIKSEKEINSLQRELLHLKTKTPVN